MSSPWFVYILECANDRLYTGITTDVARRFREHVTGRGAAFTRMNKPQRMLAFTSCPDRSQASRLEARIKRLPAADKRRLCRLWVFAENSHTP
ncbi:GIY-YIG nuclease family protein [Acidiferrobacter sp.]|jgi:putative endonuclease|uniref:GIY-YIG nuclease family protein n=1 Tax=Acidiferrobacter sp. TaxID=1872107 RepID=UPI002604744C|nr:GIY-YIG nuclease family protein [Acidiferrobacter sp.]